jgi:glycosyltransferase involved in cell wall biosynthesis
LAKEDAFMLKILIYGDIDMNVIDGSSTWVISLLKTLSQDRNNKITLLLKRPIEKWILLNSVVPHPNIEWVDCWQTDLEYFKTNTTKSSRARGLVPSDAVQIMKSLNETYNYDTVLIRGDNLVEHLIENKILAKKTIIYGLKHFSILLGEKGAEKKRELLDGIKYLACQTEELFEYFAGLGMPQNKLFILPMMIPNFNSVFTRIGRKRYTLIYAGKFSPLYNTLEILQAFDKIAVRNRQSKLLMVGSKFYNHPSVEHFEEKIHAHIHHNPNVSLLFGLSRDEVLRSIAASDACISWRSERTNKSLELSTKLLEYGSMGKPVILNRTPMHERILGKDYPLFANSQDEFIKKVELCFSSPQIYKISAERVLRVSQNYTFKKVYHQINKYFK